MDDLTLAMGLKSLMGKNESAEEKAEADNPTTASIVYMVAVTNSSGGEVVLRNETEESEAEWAEGTYEELDDDGNFEDIEEDEELEDVDDTVIDLTDGDGANVEEAVETIAFTVTDYQTQATAEYLAEVEETEVEEDELAGEDASITDEIDDGDAEELPDVGEDTEDDLADENAEITDLTDEEYTLTDDNEDDESDVVEGAEVSDGYTVADCIGTVKEGDRVAVAVQNGRLTVLGVVGSGDEQEALSRILQETADEAYVNADNALESATDAQNRVFDAEDSIEKLTNAISMLVTDEDGTTLLQQSSEGWSFNFADILTSTKENAQAIISANDKVDNVNQLIDEVNNFALKLEERIAYIDMGTTEDGLPCLELGQRNDSEGFKVLITNTSIEFKLGTQETIRLENINGEGWVVADKIIVESELKIGSFVWKEKANGNIGLFWKGGVN